MSHIRGGRVLIEVKLDGIARDEAKIKQLLGHVFLTSNEALFDLVPEPWRSFPGTGVVDNQTAKKPLSKPSQPVPAPAVPQNTASTEKGVADPIRVELGLVEGNLYKMVPPKYPPVAKAAKLQGEVVFNAVINREGMLTRVRVLRPLGLGMEESALEAMRKWRYHPYLLNGEPVEVQTVITVKYILH
jgi:TonB family protein